MFLVVFSKSQVTKTYTFLNLYKSKKSKLTTVEITNTVEGVAFHIFSSPEPKAHR